MNGEEANSANGMAVKAVFEMNRIYDWWIKART